MKKVLLFVLLCFIAFTLDAQRCAVLEFKAGVGVSQADVDGISAMKKGEMLPSVPAPAGYVDLGLPSGTLWKDKNENGFYDYDAAVRSFGSKLPNKEQLEELKNSCQWTWTGSGYKVTGPNGNSIALPAAGFRDGTSVYLVGTYGDYWSSTPSGSDYAYSLYFDGSYLYMDYYFRDYGLSVRLVAEE